MSALSLNQQPRPRTLASLFRSKLSTPSFATKLAAHFSSSQSTKSDLSSNSSTNSTSSNIIHLRPRPSYESSWGSSRAGSTTPRAPVAENVDVFRGRLPTVTPLKLSGKPQVSYIREHDPSPSRRPSSSQSRSRVRPPITSVPSKPPSIPLPDIPTPSSYYPSPKKDARQKDFRAAELSRSQANTPSSIPELPPIQISAPLLQDRSRSTTVNTEDINIDTASPERLRRALRIRNKQMEDLTAYLLWREEVWWAERKTLEKKVASLQRLLVRCDSEIAEMKSINESSPSVRRINTIPYASRSGSISSGSSSGSSSFMPPTPSPSVSMSSLPAISKGSPKKTHAPRPSISSSSTAASSAYSSKRSRSPSIAQVLGRI